MALQFKFNPFTSNLDIVQDITETISLNDLSDVTITSVAANDFFQYNGTSSLWENTQTPTWLDSQKALFGTGTDFSINYTGTGTEFTNEVGTYPFRFNQGRLVVTASSLGTAPSSGQHLEMVHDDANDLAYIFVYDRDTSAYKRLNLWGSQVNVDQGPLTVGGSGGTTRLVNVDEDQNAGTVIRVENQTNGTAAWAGIEFLYNSGGTTFLGHASARTVARYGVTLGGYGEILQSSGNGLVIGCNFSAPVIIGTNDVDRINIAAAGDITFNGSYTFPTGDGIASQVMTTDGSGNLDFQNYVGGFQTKTDEDYTILQTDGAVMVSTGASDRTMTLPSAGTSDGKIIIIKKIDSGAGKVIVDGNGAQTIDGSTTVNITMQYDSITIISNGANWFII